MTGPTGWLAVLDAGPLTTVQDRGRPGHGHTGVAPSGALDGPAAALANRLVGNGPDDAVLEATLSGPTLRLEDRPGAVRAVAVTGAVAPVAVNGRPRATHVPLALRPGDVLTVGAAAVGCRTYLAVSGGVDAAPVLGSRSTDLLGGLGPPPLATGDHLALGGDHGRRPSVDVAPVAPIPSPAVLRVIPGPRDDWMVVGALATLTAATWTVRGDSNRVGARLDGPVLARRTTAELPPEGVVTGALQVTAAGAPVVFLADHPVTGGYPVLAVVVSDDLAVAAQLRPGSPVRFVVQGLR